MKVFAAAAALATGSGFLGMAASHHLEVESDSASVDVHESSGAASLFGQFRTNTSSWLWLRTDLYLHNGVEMRPLTDAERRGGKEAESAHGDDGLHERDDLVTVIPGREHDFRGIFGDIERATTAYKPMKNHTHNDPVQALPLFRLMTWIDPKFLRGWLVGASVLARVDHAEAERYLRDGLRENPTSIALHAELGALEAGKSKDYIAALTYFDRALALGEKRFAQGVPDPESDEAQGMLSALQWASLCYRELAESGRQLDFDPKARMRAVASYGLALFPDDPVLLRSAEGQPPPEVRLEQRQEHDHHGHDH